MRHFDIVVQTGLLQQADVFIGVLMENFQHQLPPRFRIVDRHGFLQRDHRVLPVVPFQPREPEILQRKMQLSD